MAVLMVERRGEVTGDPGFETLVTEVSWKVKTLMGLVMLLLVNGTLM